MNSQQAPLAAEAQHAAEAPLGRPPRLMLRLPGTWVQVDPHRPEVTARRLDEYVRLAIGRSDLTASARRDMRSCLGQMLDCPPEAALESTFLCHEIAPGMQTPMAVSVFSPAQVHISPAVGTAPGTVVDAFVAAMDVLGQGDGWERLDCADGAAVRRWRVVETVVVQGAEDLPLRSFSADYWRTVPSSKRLVLVSVTSPLADIPQTLVRLADAIVAGSHFSFVAPGAQARPGRSGAPRACRTFSP